MIFNLISGLGLLKIKNEVECNIHGGLFTKRVILCKQGQSEQKIIKALFIRFSENVAVDIFQSQLAVCKTSTQTLRISCWGKQMWPILQAAKPEKIYKF